MESTVVTYARLKQKNKWVYSAHSLLSLQVEEHINSTQFDVVQLGELVEEIADGLHGIRNYVDDGIVMLAVGNITEFGVDVSEKRMVTQEEHERLKRSQVKKGDLLVTITGRLGTSCIYDLDDPANLSAHVARVKVKEESVNPLYLAAYLNSKIGRQLINEFSIGSIYPNININRLQNVRVILPPSYIQNIVAQKMKMTCEEATRLRIQAENLISNSKKNVEKMILGEDTVN